MVNKFYDIVFILNKQLLDIFVLNETKLDEHVDSSLFEHQFYAMLRRDRHKNGGGGIIVFIKKSLVYSNTQIDPLNSNESISFIVNLSNDVKIGVIATYRPPHPENENLFF